VLLLSLVESSDTLDSHVVRFSSSRSENDIFRICSDEIRNVLLATEGNTSVSSPFANHYPTNRRENRVSNSPSFPHRLLAQFPIHKRESYYEGFRIDWSCKEA